MARILIVDDEAEVRALVRAILERDGFDVADAPDGRSGLQAMQSTGFDLAIVDLVMPGMDGLKTIQCMRQASPRMPIIAVSGLKSSGAGRFGVDFLPLAGHFERVKCLQKPFRSHELCQAVRASLHDGAKPRPAVRAGLDRPPQAPAG